MQPNTAMPNKFPGSANGGFGTGFQARQQSAKRYPAFERQSQKEKKHRLMRDLPIFGRSRPIFVCKRRAIDAIDESASVTCRYTARPPRSPTSPYCEAGRQPGTKSQPRKLDRTHAIKPGAVLSPPEKKKKKSDDETVHAARS